jgi:hypothetical protein
MRFAVTEARDSSWTQMKGNSRHWKPFIYNEVNHNWIKKWATFLSVEIYIATPFNSKSMEQQQEKKRIELIYELFNFENKQELY